MNDKPKTLLVMRHAKSSWKQAGIADVDRPLNKRGKRDAPAMARFLEQQGIRIDHIASSSAARARATAELVIDHSADVTLDQLELRDDFYHAAPRAYLEYLTQIEDDDLQTVMVVGHNPGLESLVEMLGQSWETMPTAAIACFSVDVRRWQDFHRSAVHLIDVWRPKEVSEN